MQWRKWRNWRKIASHWRFELDAKSGPLEAGDFGDFRKNRHACNGENGETGEKSPASGDLNWMPKGAPWRLAILVKMAILAKLAILAKIARGLAIVAINIPDPWRLAILAKMAIVAKLAILAKITRNACNGENGKKLPASGDLNWMPKVAPWRLAILAKMAILVKLAILAICGKIFKLDAKSGPFKVDN